MTTYIYPPIPDRNYDWRAYLDEFEDQENMYEAYGSTQELAVSRLYEVIEDNELRDYYVPA